MTQIEGEFCDDCGANPIYMVDGIPCDDAEGEVEHECEEEGTECEQCSNFVEDGESLCESCQEEEEDHE